MNKNLVCFFDGACEPKNPGGNMGLGACIYSLEKYSPALGTQLNGLHNETPVFEYSEFMEADSDNSNNVAEYLAFEKVLQWLKQYAQTGQRVFIYGDSNLVIQQMLGNYKMRGGYYVPVAKRCREDLDWLMRELALNISLQWVPRGKNSYADSLSKKEMINHNVEFKLQKNGN